MTKTPKYGLNKPEGSDYAKVAALNDNADLLDAALHGLDTGKAGLDPETGKVKPELLPDMDYDPVGSAAAVEAKLGQHTGNKANPHGVTAAQIGAIPTAEKGTAGGVAELDSGGKVPAAQLPSYVDDVLEYANKSAFPAVGDTGKIYVAQDTNLTWRWSGSGYVEISPSLALGETSGTAYRGDRGKAAYDHSQATGNAHGLTLAQLGAAAASHTHPVSDVTGALKQFGPINLTIPLSGWTGAGPWTQNVAVSGVLAAWDWRLGLSLQKQTVTDTRKAQEKAMGCVTYCETYNGGVTLTCYEKKPEANILAVLSGEV